MSAPGITLTPGSGGTAPSRDGLELAFRREGLSPSWWSNGPGDLYAAHAHPYHKVLYCALGSIRFTEEDTGQAHELSPGDRLDIPPGVRHSALVGGGGVTCVEAARYG